MIPANGIVRFTEAPVGDGRFHQTIEVPLVGYLYDIADSTVEALIQPSTESMAMTITQYLAARPNMEFVSIRITAC